MDFEITKKDRLILINQYKILFAVDDEGRSHYEEMIHILERGYKIFYNMLDEWVAEDMSVEDGRLVISILGFYRHVEDMKRSNSDPRLAEHAFAYFRGFDGNNESSHLGFARFLIEKQGKFQEQKKYFLKNDSMNSHFPMIEKYQKMLSALEAFPQVWEMNYDQVLAVLDS